MWRKWIWWTWKRQENTVNSSWIEIIDHIQKKKKTLMWHTHLIRLYCLFRFDTAKEINIRHEIDTLYEKSMFSHCCTPGYTRQTVRKLNSEWQMHFGLCKDPPRYRSSSWNVHMQFHYIKFVKSQILTVTIHVYVDK